MAPQPPEKKLYNSVFWVEVDKIRPNPYQPRKEFDGEKLQELANSIRQYGVLQPLVVTRHEETLSEGGLSVYYELIAGERRTRAAKLAGVQQVPVLIREGDPSEVSERLKLELAIIENLQREDLTVVERARAFKRLADEFNFKHSDIAQKVGKSREYVTNSIRVLALPAEMITALEQKKISEGHTRPLLMLSDRKEEQTVLFKDIIYKKLAVREAELTARAIAQDRARKPLHTNPEITRIENELVERLGTRVRLEQKENGGKIVISFYSHEDLEHIMDVFGRNKALGGGMQQEGFAEGGVPFPLSPEEGGGLPLEPRPQMPPFPGVAQEPEFHIATAEKNEVPVVPRAADDDDDLYVVKNFGI